MAIKKQVEKAAKEVANEVKDFAMEVHEDFEGEIDPYVGKLQSSRVTGWLAVGGGVALLAIGAILGVVLS